jgi:DNA-binding NarL/FixJ family response regulator
VKIFIVDDSAVFRERLIEVLSGIPGLKVIGQAQNAQEAIKDIKKLKPDMVILDVRMLGRNGICIIKNIKKGKAAPLVIIFTNYPYSQYRKKCKEAGADFFFEKPIELQKVIEVLEKLIQRSNSQNLLQTKRWKKTKKNDKKRHF